MPHAVTYARTSSIPVCIFYIRRGHGMHIMLIVINQIRAEVYRNLYVYIGRVVVVANGLCVMCIVCLLY